MLEFMHAIVVGRDVVGGVKYEGVIATFVALDGSVIHL